MSATCGPRCRQAIGAACSCPDCRGAHHGEDGPQLRLVVELVPVSVPVSGPYPIPAARGLAPTDGPDVRAGADAPVVASAPAAVGCGAETACRAMPTDRQPHDLVVAGHRLRVSPGTREDGNGHVTEVWIATRADGRRASGSTPEAAARAALRG